MSEQDEKLAKLLTACWQDESLKARFMTDTEVVLQEWGVDVPENMDKRFIWQIMSRPDLEDPPEGEEV